MDRYDIGDLLAKVPLEEVVTRLGIETERRGGVTRALCPFHQDTRPSLNLYSADGNSPAHYHCFACGAHGIAIDLVKQVEGLEFLPAVQWLARQFSIRPIRNQASRRAGRAGASETAQEFAQRIFNARHDVEQFQSWCDERGFDPAFLHGQGLRCITRGVLVESLQAEPVGERAGLIDELQSLGLIKRLRSYSPAAQGKLDLLDQFQDCFHDGRVVIPIRRGEAKRTEVVGFAGRALQSAPPEGVPKYLLTPGFEKSEYLFNEPEAFRAVAQALKNNESARLYLVEGFLDALRLQSLGQPAVALMGISLGKGQFERLTKLSQKMPGTAPLAYCIFLDNDPAGFGGADRLARGLLGLTGVDMRWVGMPWRTEPSLGKDPDSSLRGLSTPEEAAAWLKRYDLPAEAVLLASALGSQDASELQLPRWDKLAATARERALFRTVLAVSKLHGRRSPDSVAARLKESAWVWAQELHAMMGDPGGSARPNSRSMYLDESYPRAALARALAYHGSRRGELPSDDEAWQTLSGNERLFDQTAFARLRATVADAKPWRQAALLDAVQLPRKFTADPKVLGDPRLKVMPHPADLHVQQLLLNELLTQRHDRLAASGGVFSDGIPAVRWYASRQAVEVTGPFDLLNEPDIERDEPETLSFGYQVDMDVLEGDKTPSDQGMFRPFGQCWRAFMACLTDQCHAIGPRVHVLRLDAKRYYDSIQRYLVRDALLTPLKSALTTHGVPEGFRAIFGFHDADAPNWDAALERLVSGLVFEYEYRDPGAVGAPRQSDAVMGIAQGPVLSAYLGTIALFPVDEVARRFMRDTAESLPDGQWRQRAGYARYVDDIVLFADSQELLKKLPLQQELAKVLKHFSDDASVAKKHVDDDFEALGELLTVAQSNRERRSVLLVPACTTRSNDYWHAGQASVLASGTATVFCNTSNLHGAGGSCFIGIDSVVPQNGHHAGIVHLLTPYHGWHKGILQPNGKGALSKTDQALVVVDLDPVHVVSGKPRPQLLPEPMSLVAYLPIVEVVNKQENAENLSTALKDVLTPEGQNVLRRLLKAKTFPAPCGPLHERGAFGKALEELLEAKRNGELTPDVGGETLDTFAALFGDASAVRERIMAWLKDRHQQPAPKAGKEQLEPAWLDFLVADLTWEAHADDAPSIRVPAWRADPSPTKATSGGA